MQNFHPIFVHFPIALLVSFLLFHLLGYFLKKESFLTVAKWNLWLGTLFAIGAVGTGWFAEESMQHMESAHNILELHEELGWTILIASIFLSLWHWKANDQLQEKARPYVILFQLVLIGVLAYGAYLGGRLVYEFGVGTSISQEPLAEAVLEPLKDEKAAQQDHHIHSQPPKNQLESEKEKSARTNLYSCPMKCEGTKSYSKPVKCPKCGMNLVLSSQ